MLKLKKPSYIKKPKRKGIGIGSGIGKTAGRGTKGQRARGKGKVNPYSEGGQTPLYRRLPKRGFNNPFKKVFSVINVERLNIFKDNESVSLEKLVEKGIVKGNKPVKILGQGELKVTGLKITAHAASKSAIEKLKKANCELTLLDK